MNYRKTPGFAVLAMVALMTFTSTASATTLTSPAGTVLGTGTVIHFESIGHVVLHAPYKTIECSTTLEGKITNAGGTGVSVSGSIASIGIKACTGEEVITVLSNGSLTITGTGSGSGTLSSNGTEMTVETLGIHCIYKTSNTTLGTVTGSSVTGSNAMIDASATIPRTGGRSGAFCGSTAPLTGTYKITSPNPLIVDP